MVLKNGTKEKKAFIFLSEADQYENAACVQLERVTVLILFVIFYVLYWFYVVVFLYGCEHKKGE